MCDEGMNAYDSYVKKVTHLDKQINLLVSFVKSCEVKQPLVKTKQMELKSCKKHNYFCLILHKIKSNGI